MDVNFYQIIATGNRE